MTRLAAHPRPPLPLATTGPGWRHGPCRPNPLAATLEFAESASAENHDLAHVSLRRLRGDGVDRELIDSIANIGPCLGVDVTAEGVEHADQAEVLKGCGYDLLQSFLLSKPLDASSAAAQLPRGWIRMRFRHALLRRPDANMIHGLTRHDLGVPQLALALQQHAAYCEALQACGLTLKVLDADPNFPDGCFVEDTAIITLHGALLTRPGAAPRQGEIAAVAAALAPYRLPLARIEAPGTLDGGDVCVTERDAFIGLSARSNEAGARQLVEWLQAQGIRGHLIDIREGHDLLHLKSGLTWLGERRLLIAGSLAGHPALAGYETVPVDDGEAYAANAIRVNDHVLIAAGYPKTEQSLRALGYSTIALAMREFAKLDGGLSCLSLRF